MSNQQEQFYEVTMTVEVTKRVLASSVSDALEKTDTEDMVHEIQHGGVDPKLTAKAIKGVVPDEYDRINAIGQQIVKNCYDPMHWLRKDYQKIREINQQLEKAGKSPHEPAVFQRMTDDFLERLKRE